MLLLRLQREFGWSIAAISSGALCIAAAGMTLRLPPESRASPRQESLHASA